jgi:hypothetical protein
MPRRPDPDHHLPKHIRAARARRRQEFRERERARQEERRRRVQGLALDPETGAIRTPLKLKEWCELRGVSYATALREYRAGRLELVNLTARMFAVTPQGDRSFIHVA